jgi:glycosyltransferase involved in cell wall biosynthesis
MHVALLANTAWLDEELSSYQNLVVALIDEQVRVAQVLPADLPADDCSPFGARLTWQQSRWRAVNRHRLVRLGEELQRMGVDLVHALDGRLWPAAAALAQRIEAAAVLTAFSYRDIKVAQQLSKKINPARVAFVGTTEPISSALREVLDPAVVVQTIVQGIHARTAAERPARSPEALCAIVSGNGQLDDRYQSLLEGMMQVTEHHPLTQFFFDGQGSDQHQIWREASRLGLLANMSLVPRRLGHRELLLRADVLIHPQPLGRSRSLTLQAMAHGIAVLAHQDPWLDYLIDHETAWVLDRPNAEQWSGAIRRLIEQPQAAMDLGQRAQHWISENRLASQQIGRLLDLYRRMLGSTLPFPG